MIRTVVDTPYIALSSLSIKLSQLVYFVLKSRTTNCVKEEKERDVPKSKLAFKKSCFLKNPRSAEENNIDTFRKKVIDWLVKIHSLIFIAMSIMG